MTQEEIEQKAEEYVSHLILSEQEEENYKLTFIDGAHSRDEEIKELKEETESLKENEKELFDGFEKRGIKLGELMKENVKLRNPWISVEDALPERFVDAKGKVYDFSNKILVKLKKRPDYWYLAEYLHNDKEWICLENNTYVIRDEVTHWMDIKV